MAAKVKGRKNLQDLAGLKQLAREVSEENDPRVKEMLSAALEEAYEEFQHERQLVKKHKEQTKRDEEARLINIKAVQDACERTKGHKKPNGESDIAGQWIILKDPETGVVSKKEILQCQMCRKRFNRESLPPDLLPKMKIGHQHQI